MTDIAESGVGIADELTNHKTCVEEWVKGVSALEIPTSKTNVIKRFVRDCNTLITDIDTQEKVSMDDMCDFDDRRCSLEVQYLNIVEGRP